MRKRQLLISLLAISLLLSCDSEDDHFSDTEKNLIDGAWILESEEEFYYYNDKFNNSKLSTNNTNSHVLLFTKDYQAFCNENLGGFFFHHEPIINASEQLPEKNYERELTLYLSYIIFILHI